MSRSFPALKAFNAISSFGKIIAPPISRQSVIIGPLKETASLKNCRAFFEKVTGSFSSRNGTIMWALITKSAFFAVCLKGKTAFSSAPLEPSKTGSPLCGSFAAAPYPIKCFTADNTPASCKPEIAASLKRATESGSLPKLLIPIELPFLKYTSITGARSTFTPFSLSTSPTFLYRSFM